MFTTVSARQIQREYKKLFEKANRSKEPIVVMANNKVQGAIIGADALKQLQQDYVLHEAIAEYNAGETTSVTNKKELKAFLKELREAAKNDTD